MRHDWVPEDNRADPLQVKQNISTACRGYKNIAVGDREQNTVNLDLLYYC